jgi:hypothetical protein
LCCKSKTQSFADLRDSPDVFAFLSRFWGYNAWMDHLNANLTVLGTGDILMEHINDMNERDFVHRKPFQLKMEYAGQKYILMKKKKKRQEDAADDDDDDETNWILSDFLPVWLSSSDRAFCLSETFDPERPIGRSSGSEFFNLYQGFGILPKEPRDPQNPAPVLMRHLKVPRTYLGF